MMEEAQAGRFQHVRLQPPGEHSGGYYSGTDRAIYLDVDIFKTLSKDKTERLDRITYVLGHETAHSALSEGRAHSTKAFTGAVHAALWTESDFGHVDLTKPAERYLQYARQDESMATIAAWNVLADRVDREDAGPLSQENLLKRVAAVGDCVVGADGNSFKAAPGITLDAQQRIIIGSPLAQSDNVEAVGVCYYDKLPQEAKLGRNGNSDYTNHYGAVVVGTIASHVRAYETETGQRAHDVRLDFEQLGLKAALLEANGLELGGKNFVLFDTSGDRVRGVSLKHSDKEGQDNPETERRIVQQPGAPLLSEQAHSDNGLFRQALALVHEQDRKSGRVPDEDSERRAAMLTVNAKASGMTEIRSFGMSKDGTRAFVIDSADPYWEGANRAYADVATAVQKSLSTSTERLSQVNDELDQKAELERQQAPSKNMNTPENSGPVMKIGARGFTSPSDGSASSGGNSGGGGDG